MIQKNRTFSFYQLFIIISLSISFLVISSDTLHFGFNMLLEKEMRGGLSTYFSLIIIFVFLLSLLKVKYKRQVGIYIILLVYFLYFFFTYNLFIASTIRDIIGSLLILMWLFSFKLGGDIANWGNVKFDKFILCMNTLVIIPLLITAFNIYYHNDLRDFKLIGNDAIFAIAVYLPYIFMLRTQKILKLLLFVAFLIISFLSYKRSIIVAIIASTFIYIYITVDRKNILRYIFKWYSIVIVIGSVFLYSYVKYLVGENIINRFNSISEDKGSGRIDIYNKLLETFQNSNSFEIWLGHGFQSTNDYIGMLAHNDFIQIAFDFGLIGASLYLIYVFSILNLAIKKFKNRKLYLNEYASYIGAIMLFIILTQMNCFIYSPSLMVPIMFFLGMNYFKLNIIENYEIEGANKLKGIRRKLDYN